jgi:hypothetical protein
MTSTVAAQKPKMASSTTCKDKESSDDSEAITHLLFSPRRHLNSKDKEVVVVERIPGSPVPTKEEPNPHNLEGNHTEEAEDQPSDPLGEEQEMGVQETEPFEGIPVEDDSDPIPETI